MFFRAQVREHTGSYQTITAASPVGLQCLKAFFEEEDSMSPNGVKLKTILAKDFRQFENGNERSRSRDVVIGLITSRKTRYRNYQTDIAQAWCVMNHNKTHTVLFEGIRFVVLLNDTEWIRIPLSGRIEVRPITINGKDTGEVVLRKMTFDLSTFWRRKKALAMSSPSPNPSPTQAAAGRFSMYELPAPFPTQPKPQDPNPTSSRAQEPEHQPDQAYEEPAKRRSLFKAFKAKNPLSKTPCKNPIVADA
ncbi:hypothetical protein DM02DRAFT_654808 [Periconia macrospinosa]|uniref:Uncharacterized protein n=1 Tax=Periconia macrospinosa TaxID=97972 RepID=A0A2V1DSZ3_9PLEO|nr:hypothetical protein DM02DRAFT_654808 [Periconia macrospinosa]